MTPSKQPNPGSAEAVEAGCRCPIYDNNKGRGLVGYVPELPHVPFFYINEDCPLHGTWPEEIAEMLKPTDPAGRDRR